jgi:hypothetical protein
VGSLSFLFTSVLYDAPFKGTPPLSKVSKKEQTKLEVARNEGKERKKLIKESR